MTELPQSVTMLGLAQVLYTQGTSTAAGQQRFRMATEIQVFPGITQHTHTHTPVFAALLQANDASPRHCFLQVHEMMIRQHNRGSVSSVVYTVHNETQHNVPNVHNEKKMQHKS